MKRETLRALTGLRFVAALGVVYSHFGPPSTLSLHSGYMGVDFFFLLSGFILAYTYSTPNGAFLGTRRAFYVARFARIYPAYLVGFLLAFGLVARGVYADEHSAAMFVQHPIGVLLTTLTLTHAWVPYWSEVFSPPATTLAVEACFYALFPFLVLAFGRLSQRGLLLAVPLLWLLEMAPTAALAWCGITPDIDTQFMLHWFPPVRLPEFCCGLVLGLLYLRGHRLHGAALLVPLTMAALLLAPFVAGQWPLWVLVDGGFDPIGMLLIFAVACGQDAIVRLFSTQLAIVLGEISYGLYIIHYPLHQWVPALSFPVYVALSMACAALLNAVIETPARRWIRARYAAPRNKPLLKPPKTILAAIR